jgi:hypothetical protein
MARPLLNYTTTVPVSRSIGQVHALLVEGGARQIMTAYDDVGTPTGVSFAIQVPGGTRGFKLPVQTDRVLAVLLRAGRQGHGATPNAEQAERVAWRIAKDWLEAQLAIVKTEMVTFEQVMLPYMQSEDGRTLYELYVEGEVGRPALMPSE